MTCLFYSFHIRRIRKEDAPIVKLIFKVGTLGKEGVVLKVPLGGRGMI